MTKKLLFMLLFGVMVISPFGQKAQAYSPYLSANWEGNNNVRININSGQSYTSIDVYYKTVDSQMWSVVTNIGSTDGSGYYSGLVDLGVTSWSGVTLYAKVGYELTSTVNLGYGGGSGCWGTNCNVGGMTFSENNVSLVTGQSRTVSVYTPYLYSGSYYISSNSNSNVASASISGNSLYINALVSGTTNISVCQNNVSSCATLYITVSGGSGTGNNQVSIRDNYYSPQTITIPAGTDITWRNEGSMNHTVTFSAPYSDSGTIYSGGTYTKTFATPGTYYYNCRFHSGMTGMVIVTASGGGSGNVWFSPASPNLYVGQSLAVSINSSAYATAYPYYTNAYYISSNSNSNVASASISGTVLNLHAYQNGSTNISVCHSSLGFCSTLYVTVGGGSSYGGNLSLSQTNATVGINQNVNVTVSGSGGYYISSNSNPNVATASLSGSTIYIYGQNPGSTTMNVCYSSGGQCAYLYVTVSGYCTGWNCNNNIFNFISTTLPQPTVGQYYSQQMQVTDGAGVVTYTLQSGTLPTGLYLSAAGQIYGTPTSNSATYFTIRANDSYGKSAVQSFSLIPTSSNVLGSLLYSNGTLIKENNTIYITYKSMKTGFTNRSAFEGLGFKFGNVNYVISSGLSDSGYNVWTSASSHPWGSWIKSGNTVYFVHESGLIPVSNYDVFLNNGGQDYLVVRSNYYDFQLPMLTVMEYNDYRLK